MLCHVTDDTDLREARADEALHANDDLVRSGLFPLVLAPQPLAQRRDRQRARESHLTARTTQPREDYCRISSIDKVLSKQLTRKARSGP